MKEINTIVISLEYALTNQALDIPSATLSILQDMKKQGLVLGLTSSKPLSFMQRYLKVKHLETLFSFLIGSNGAEYINLKNNQTFVDQSLFISDLENINELCRRMQLVCGVNYQNELYFSKFDLFAFFYALRHRIKAHFKGFDLLPGDAKFSQILVFGNNTLLGRFENNFLQYLENKGISYPTYDMAQYQEQIKNSGYQMDAEAEISFSEEEQKDPKPHPHSFHLLDPLFETDSAITPDEHSDDEDEIVQPTLFDEVLEETEIPAADSDPEDEPETVCDTEQEEEDPDAISLIELQAFLHRNYAIESEQVPLRIVHTSEHEVEILPPTSSIYLRLENAIEQFCLNRENILYYGATDKDSLAMLYTYGVAMKGTPRYISDCCHKITKYNGAQNGIGYNLNTMRVENICEFIKQKRKKR
ncbi:MAG: HAD hydrolase family protein [Allobaculum sp.]